MLHSLIGLALLWQGGDFQYTPHEEPPIAYFDVVPQQDVVGVFDMGVVAYHLEGIDRVEYTIRREGYEGDFNKDGTVDAEDISALFSNWDPNMGGKALTRTLGHWGTARPIADEVVVIRDQTFNERTGQEEYWFGLDTRLYPDVKTTITAEVFPVDGPSVVLNDNIFDAPRPQYNGVTVFANNYEGFLIEERYVSPNGSDETGDGTLNNPYKNLVRALRHNEGNGDIEVGGTVIYLMEGDHVFDTSFLCAVNGSCTFSTDEGRYVTITPAPGVSREAAKIVSFNGSLGLRSLSFLRFKNVYIETDEENVLTPRRDTVRWYDNCVVSGVPEDWLSRNYYKLSNTSGLQYWTDCTQKYLAEGHAGIIMRNMHMDYIHCDVLEMHWIQMALDVLITNHNANVEMDSGGCHVDYVQVNGGFEYIHQNIIFRDIYGNHSCREQGVHACPGLSEKHNVAWVNVQLSNTGGNGLPECNIPAVVFRWCGPGKNNLFKNCIFNDKPNESTNTVSSFDRFNEDGSENTEGPWSVGHDGGPRFRNVKIEDCWNNWEKTKPLFLVPDASEPWGFPGPEELQFDSDTRDGLNENPFGPNDPWFSPITGIMYTQTE